MPEGMSVQYLAVQLSGSGIKSTVGGTALVPIMVAASVGLGGGFTVVGAQFTAGTATNAGTAYTLELVHGGAAGTALGGTCCAAIGGTASPVALNTVYAFTVGALCTFAAGDSLSVKVVDQGAVSNPTGVLAVQYVAGR